MNSGIRRKVNYKNLNMFFGHKDGLKRQIEDFLYGSLPHILHIEDRNSMASSVETRLPFLDYIYVEKILSISILEKIKDGYTKYPLREYMEDFLPREVVWRKNKLGFPAPHTKWLLQMPEGYVRELMDNPKSEGIFDMKKIRKAYLKGRGNLEMVEKFIAVELWMRIFQVSCEE